MKDFYPLSKTEEGIYVSCLKETDAYNLTNYINLGKDVDADKLRRATEAVFEAHPYLFTVLFIGNDGKVYKKIVPEKLDIPLIEEDEFTLSSPPFKMTDEHLYRLSIHLVKGEYIFVYDFHHIIFDGTSIKSFIDQVIKGYFGETLKKEDYDANRFAVDEEKILSGKEYDDAKKYFEKTIVEPDIDSGLIFDKSDGEEKYGSFVVQLEILNDDVKKLTSSINVKTSSFFLSAFAFLLSKINMEDKALFLTVNNGRNELVKDCMGMFVKTFPFYLENKETVEEYIRSASEQLKESVKNLAYPFSDIVKDLGVNSGVMFAYQGDYFYKTEFNGKTLYVEQAERKDGKGNISIELHRDNGKFFVWVEYRSDLYEEST
ncbi:MAG: hypothetical protein J6Y43_00130, partial [Clostridia bacterium]|nr:hypothetical protein [Clostridia bacterium]